MAKSFYLEQLKKKNSLYPLGKDDPKKKLGIMAQYARQALHRGNIKKVQEVRDAAKGEVR